MHPGIVKRSILERPFRPFVLHLAGGRSLTAPSPECIRMSDNGRLVLVYPASGSTHIVDLYFVTDVEFPNRIVE